METKRVGTKASHSDAKRNPPLPGMILKVKRKRRRQQGQRQRQQKCQYTLEPIKCILMYL